MFKKTVLVHALTLAFGAAVLSASVVQTASAQSNASGNIVGTVEQPTGTTVNLVNTGTGLKPFRYTQVGTHPS